VFNLKDLETECFGGNNLYSEYNENWWEKEESSKNAYLLLYEKHNKDPI
jgi:hypothetical protein